MPPRCYTKFHKFLCKLLANCDEEYTISLEAKDILDQLVHFIATRYAKACRDLSLYSQKVTLDSECIVTITRIWFGDECSNELLEYAYNVWEYYTTNTSRGITKHARAGLHLPPSRIKNIFRDQLLQRQQLGETCYLFTTAIIEYIITAILNNCIKLSSKKMVTGVYIFNTLNSKEIQKYKPIFKNIFIAGFGYIGDETLIARQELLVEKLNDCGSDHSMSSQ